MNALLKTITMYGVRAKRDWTNADAYPSLYSGGRGGNDGNRILVSKGHYLSNHRDSDGSLAHARLWPTPQKVVQTFKQTYYNLASVFEIVPIEIVIPDDNVGTTPIIL